MQRAKLSGLLLTALLSVWGAPLQAQNEASIASELKFRQALDSPAAQYSQALLTQAYQRLGLTPQFIEVPFGRSLVESNKGLLDGEIARVLMTTEHYPNLIAVPYVLFDTEVILYINQSRCHGCNDLSRIKNVAYVRGSVIVDWLLQHARHSITPVSANSLEQVELLFTEQKVDAAIFTSYDIASTLLDSIPYQRNVIMTLPDYHLLHNQHRALANTLALELFKLEQEGIAQALRLQFGINAPKWQLSDINSSLKHHY